MAIAVGRPAPDLVFGSSSGDLHLADLWREGPLVLAFLRHFG